MNDQRIYLSPPNVGDHEKDLISAAIDSGWVAPAGPFLGQFEAKLEQLYNDRKVLLVNSGTSALHLSLILAGVNRGDKVITSTLTFAACANVILYQMATPVFLDCEHETWNLDPDLLEEYLKKTKVPPKAIIVTHLYGMPAQMDKIREIANAYEVTLIEDAAEALGSTFNGTHVGQFGDYGVISFNGNKILTTSGGGALICNQDDYERALHLATQANRGTYEYDHDKTGYNYRMSNLLAGLGMAQFERLDQFIAKKRSIYSVYKEQLSGHLDFLVEPENSRSNRWLSVGLIKSKQPPEGLIKYLDSLNIETRKLWKPLHLHKAYNEFEFIGRGTSESLFETGVCLPSGTSLSEVDQERVILSIQKYLVS